MGGNSDHLPDHAQSRDAEIRRLESSVNELRAMLHEQGRILSEQNAMLTAMYAAGTAAANTLAALRPPDAAPVS